MDPPLAGDDSDALSDYSSCDGSDFDKYCSANSAFGSASCCSTDSLRAPTDNRTIRDNFWRSKWNYSHHTAGIDSSPVADGVDVDADVDSGLSGGDCSGDEDAESMLGGVVRARKTAEFQSGGGNPLIMNSAAAFGADDWDEFEEGNGGIGFAELTIANEMEQGPVENPLLDYHQVEKKSVVIEENRCMDVGIVSEMQSSCRIGSSEEVVGKRDHPHPLLSDPKQNQDAEVESLETLEFDGDKGGLISSSRIIVEEQSSSMDMLEKDILPREVAKLDPYNVYDEMVHEMEDILLDSEKSVGSRFVLANQGYIAQQSQQLRDGSSTASTSGTDAVHRPVHHSSKIDWVEVVGAKQKKGDVSFGERLVGVKQYTEYKLRVHSGTDQWEVERRYRDFYALYRQLKSLFEEHGLSLPPPWSHVENESRKIFGNVSPDVVSERSTLIQNCLYSILEYRWPFGTPKSLIFFLSSSNSTHRSGFLKALVPQSSQKLWDDDKAKVSCSEDTSPEFSSMFGQKISLVVEIKVHKSMRQMLEAQNYRCAGCHRQLDSGKTLLREIVQTLGWNKPRLCEYTSQLFCASCHTNDTAVLPARVLNLWDFSLCSVSQLAKAYLESIYDQPMLCVTAVNPFLFSKVPALLQVASIRKKIGSMLPYVRCPFRKSIQRGMGLRRHLLQSNDFFALRDLVDLSKGAFAALPIMLETISSKILEHITQQCLECYDSGVPCAARQTCEDPSSLIFPFQEAEAMKCGSCGSIYHKPCFFNIMDCPCVRPNNGTAKVYQGAHRSSNESPDYVPTSTIYSDILSKARTDRHKSAVILMSSLSNN